MRVPTDVPHARPRPVRRFQIWIIAAVVLVIVLLLALQGLANFYTNYLWYRSVHFTMVWRSMVETKLALSGFFVAIFFLACWASLYTVDRITPEVLPLAPEQEIVRRYHQIVGGHRAVARTAISLVIALIVGSSAAGQWQHWLLYRHGKPFGISDPQFHRDVSFYVFKLPFLSFLVDWTLVALLVLLIVTGLAHYLSGAVRLHGASPRVDPQVAAHMSAILAVMALVRTLGYFYVDRYALDLSTGGIVDGATYTDVHVRLPAIELLAVVALVAFALMVFNVYQRSLTLPLVGAGLWVLVALAVGVIVPAAVQAFEVTPAQSSLELPYITRNITATRSAMGLAAISEHAFAGNQDLTDGVVAADRATLDNLPLWDSSIAAVQQTYQKISQNSTGFTLGGLSLDRYRLNGTLTPTIIGVRQVTTADLPNQSWVNTHLQYTHGYGAILSPANTFPNDTPSFVIGNIPPQSSGGAPQITQPSVYFGVGQTGYVVVDTRQPEIDYSTSSGKVSQAPAYSGSGGIPIGSFWTRAAFALRFHDLNLLISKLISPQSRLLFVQDIRQRVAKVAPFLQVDANPYAVIDNGHIDWIVDAYTTTSYYPYAQQADTSTLPATSGLATSFNYVRNSVKVVIDAYDGSMTFYAMTQSDPILQTWEATFPGMFKPVSAMDATLKQHLRYPQDLLTVQSQMYGRYHLTSAASWYSANNAWEIAPTSGNGSPSQGLPTDQFGNTLRFTPEYEILQLPGATSPGFDLIEPLDPQSQNDRLQSLASFIVASCDYQTYGQLSAYVTPTNRLVTGPAVVNSRIQSNTTISERISLLDARGSNVALGTTLVIPIDDSLLYVRPLYVSGSQNALPQLRYIIVVYGTTVAMQPTLGAALAQVFGPAASTVGPGSGSGAIPAAVRSLLDEAQAAYASAQAALRHADFAGYAADIAKMEGYLQDAQVDLGSLPKKSASPSTSPKAAKSSKLASNGVSQVSSRTSTSSSTTTTTPAGARSTTSTTVAPSSAPAISSNATVPTTTVPPATTGTVGSA